MELKNSEQTLGVKTTCRVTSSKNRKMRIQKSPNFMIFGPIACFRRSGSRFSGQKRPRSSEMRVYIGNTGHIKNHQKFKILFWSWDSKKPIFMSFPDFFTKKSRIRETGIRGVSEPGISSETP